MSLSTTERPAKRWAASLTGLFLALIVPALATSLPAVAPSGGSGSAIDPVTAVIYNEAGIWVLTLIVLALVVFWEKRSLSSIGFNVPTAQSLRDGAAVVLTLWVVVSVIAWIAEKVGVPKPPAAPEELVLGLPLWLQAFVALTAGFTEEVLFRGYPIERITELTGSRWAGAIVPIIVFAGAHIPFWGVMHGVMVGMIGLVLTILYIRQRNLWTNIAAHAMWDLLIFVVGDVYGVSG